MTEPESIIGPWLALGLYLLRPVGSSINYPVDQICAVAKARKQDEPQSLCGRGLSALGGGRWTVGP